MQSCRDWFVEVCDGLHRKTPAEMIKVSDLAKWQMEHQASNAGLFSSVFSYYTNDPYVGGVLSDFYLDFSKRKTIRKKHAKKQSQQSKS